MSNIFEVSATIHLIDRFSSGFGKLALGFAQSQKAADALNARMKLIHSTFNAGAMMIGGGLALAAPLIMATNEAAKLEASLKNVQNITRANNEEMAKYGPLLTNISHKTAAFSKPMLANFASKMAQGGIRDSKGIQDLLPLFADAADVLKFSKHMDPLHVAEALTSVAHQFGKYTPDAELKKIVSNFVTGMQIAPGTVNQFVRGGSYVNPLGKRIFNMDPTDLMALQIASAQTSGGGGGRGAMSPSNQMNVIKRSLPGLLGSGLLDGKSPFALRIMGISDNQGLSTLKTGNKLDMMKLSDRLASFEKLGQTNEGRMEIARTMLANASMLGKKAPEMEKYAHNVLGRGGNVLGAEVTMKALQYAFGSGGSFAALLGDKSFREQLQFVKHRMNTDPSLDKKQQEYSGTLEFSQIQASTDLKSLMADVGMRMIPTFTKAVKAIDMIIFKIDDFVLKNPKAVDAITGTIAALSGLLIIGGVGNMISAAVMGLRFVATPLLLCTRIMGPLGLAITAVMLVVQNWDKILGFVAEHQGFFNHIAAETGRTVQMVSGRLVELGAALMGLFGRIGAGLAQLPFMGDVAKKIADWQAQTFKAPSAEQNKADMAFNDKMYGSHFVGSNGPKAGTVTMAPLIPIKPIVNPAANPMASARTNGAAGKTTIVNHTTNIQPGAFVLKGDPKQNGDSVMRHLADLRQAAAASTTAGGVDTSRWAQGAGH
jgi:hypothetical protein